MFECIHPMVAWVFQTGWELLDRIRISRDCIVGFFLLIG